jgi:hypothetical protein
MAHLALDIEYGLIKNAKGRAFAALPERSNG